jgi:hypothetical protein
MGVLAIPICRKYVPMARVGFVSPMKMWMSPIGMMEKWERFLLAGT